MTLSRLLSFRVRTGLLARRDPLVKRTHFDHTRMSPVSGRTGTEKRPRLTRRVGAGIVVMAMTLSLVIVGGIPAWAEIVPKVPMGSLGDFSILAGTAVTSVGTSSFEGNVGVWSGSTMTGIAASDVIAPATIHAGDSVAQQAQADLSAAYLDTAGRTPTNVAAELGGLTLVGGVYRPGSAALALTGTLTLDGANDLNSVFIFQTAGGFDTAAASDIVLINGAQECNIFFQVAGSATLGASSDFSGYIFAQTAVTVGASVDFHGGAFARDAAVTLDGDNFIQPTCLQAVTTTTAAVTTTTAATTTTAVATTTSTAAVTTTTATAMSTSTTAAGIATTTTSSGIGAVGPGPSSPIGPLPISSASGPSSGAGVSSGISSPRSGTTSSGPGDGGTFADTPRLTELPFTGVPVTGISLFLIVTLTLGTSLIWASRRSTSGEPQRTNS